VEHLPEEHRGNDRAVRFDRRELAGAVADLGVLVPIGVTLIVANGLSATAVLLPAGLLYVAAALVYRLPVPVQPLKAFGAIAIAKGLGADEIAAGALLMGGIFVVLGRTGLLDLASRAFPRAIVRGVQLTVGLLFLKIAWELLREPPEAFASYALPAEWALPLGVATVALAFLFRRRAVTLALVGIGVGVMVATGWEGVVAGPSQLGVPSIDLATLGTAFTLLVLPQVPLSFANSCLATADAARTYFGRRAERVRPGRLATTFGTADLLAGAIGGMPVCHGAGGMTAHYSFGARTGGAPLAMGVVLLALALGLGAGLGEVLAAFPLPILAGLLATAGVLHIGLLRDLSGARAWAIALSVGAIGFVDNLAIGLAVGLVLWWVPVGLRRLRAATA
jgi:sulfate permease, SulP family